MQATKRVLHALNQPEALDSTTLKYLEDILLFTFPRDDELKKESAGCLCNLLFNEAVKSINNPERGQGIFR